MNSVFEAVMLICFGAAWPVSIYKSWTSRTAAGKSVVFLVIVFLGYLAGITNRVMNEPNYVLGFYILNAVMVATDLVLYYRNRSLDLRLADSISGGTPMDGEMRKRHF